MLTSTMNRTRIICACFRQACLRTVIAEPARGILQPQASRHPAPQIFQQRVQLTTTTLSTTKNSASFSTVPAGKESTTQTPDKVPILEQAYEFIKNKPEPMTQLDWEQLPQSVDLNEKGRSGARVSRFWDMRLLDWLITQGNESDFEIVDSLYEFASKERGESNIALLVLHLLHCANTGRFEQMLERYQQLFAITDVLDRDSYEKLIKAFSQTSQWRECYKFLDMLKEFYTTNPKAYSYIVAAALQNGDLQEAWDMLDTMAKNDQPPTAVVYSRLLQHCPAKQVFDMLEVMKKHRWIPTHEVALMFKDWFESQPRRKDWICRFTRMGASSGCCPACLDELEPMRFLTPAEFSQLRKDFMELSLQRGTDIYINTTPKELEFFQGFLRRCAPFEVVIDALNISNKIARGYTLRKKQNVTALKNEMLLKVVEYFTLELKKPVLVFGKHHMKKHIKDIQRIAQVYLVDNRSSDDTFAVYAALYNGPNTLLVTSDHLRDHRFLLGPEQGELFKLWQRNRQVMFLGPRWDDGSLKFWWPEAYDTCIQETRSGWHIPFEDGAQRPSHQMPNSWLCARRKI